MFEKRLVQIDFDDKKLYTVDNGVKLNFDFDIEIPEINKNSRVVVNEGTITNLCLVEKARLIYESFGTGDNNISKNEIYTANSIHIDKNTWNLEEPFFDTITYETYITFLNKVLQEFDQITVLIKCFIKRNNKLHFELKCFTDNDKYNNFMRKAILRNLINNYKIVFDLNIEYYLTEE